MSSKRKLPRKWKMLDRRARKQNNGNNIPSIYFEKSGVPQKRQ